MVQFDRGETVICKRNVKVDDEYTDPDGNFVLEVYHKETGDVIQESDDMITTGVVGKFYYPLQLGSEIDIGIYEVKYTVLHGGYITIHKAHFEVI